MRRVLPWLLVPIAAVAAFAVARFVALESIAGARRSEWATRPEVENWADPYYGLDWLPAALIAGVITLAVAALVAYLLRRRNREVA